jgi:DNA-binding NarL/FixJ family response regulator
VRAPVRIVVGDPPVQRRWVCGALASDRRVLVVGEAETAPAAVAVTLSEQPGLCLLGTRLQGSAIGAVWEIASRLPTTRIVVLSDSLDPREFFASIRAGATSYLLRSMDPRRLVPALLDVLSGKPAIPRSLVALLVSEYRDHGPRRRMLVPPLPGAALTSREWEVLDLVGKGCDTGEIARLLHVSRATVRSHRAAAQRKVGRRGAAR